MKQNIKNTLYRFVTMRAPELIGDVEKQLGFVQFPESETSAFITPASQASTPEAKKQAIDTAVDAYRPTYASKKELKDANSNFYELATWLTANRTKFSLNELTAKVDAFNQTGTSIPSVIGIWDDLHFNILTGGDSYLRDTLLSYLVAKFFLDNQGKVAATAKDLQKLAQARVVINKNLFANESSTEGPRQLKVSNKHFKKQSDAVMSKLNTDELQEIAKEVSRVKKQLSRENQKAKDAYQITYDQAVRDAYDAATVVERVITDPDTGATTVVVEYENLVMPTYQFTPTADLDKVMLASRVSSETVNYITDVETQLGATTLDEVDTIIQEEISTNTATTFENTDFEASQVVIPGGVPVPVSTNPNVVPFSYNLCPRRKIGSSLYNVLLTVNVPNSSYDVVAVTTDAGTSTFTDFMEFNSGTIITLKLADSGIDLSQPVDLDITLEFSNGETYELSLVDFTKKCYLGELEKVTSSQTPTPTDAPVAFGIQRLGIADYRKVEQEVCCYVPGEVSHIENIMAREYKSKDVKRTRRQETTETSSKERERENLTETTSTDRFDMNQEIASINSQDQSFNASAGIRWGNDNFGGNADASFSNNISSEVSQNQAISHAKEITEKALDKVVQKVREERVTKIIEEYEETTSHGFDNRKGDKHVSGVYRWVDKVYENKILNYGKRLMYEFMIPEPASFHDVAISIKDQESQLVKPLDPRTASIKNMADYREVTNITYAHWAAIYNAEVEPAPEETMMVTKSYVETINEQGHEAFTGRAYTGEDFNIESGMKRGGIEIPEGYKCVKVEAQVSYNREGSRRNGELAFHVANKSASAVTTTRTWGSNVMIIENTDISDSLSFTLTANNINILTFNIVMHCELKDVTREAWQLKTFNSIIEAYEERLTIYEEKYASEQNKQKETVNFNPGFYREIEKTVLRKNCISYLIGHENIGQNMIENRTSVADIVPKYSNPALDAYAAKVKFFEQAFEWDIMSYYFYPFYWANKEKWCELYQTQNDDPLFKAFLQSGMARVIITVRPGFEEMVNWYMATGQIWNGGQVPTLDDEEFVSIVEELRNPESEVEETWETRVPTSLTVIQAGAIGLNVEGFPCNDKCDDWLRFDTDGNPVVDANGNPISDNPIVQSDELVGDVEAGVGNDVVGATPVQ
jgi:methionine aminopeptidase